MAHIIIRIICVGKISKPIYFILFHNNKRTIGLSVITRIQKIIMYINTCIHVIIAYRTDKLFINSLYAVQQRKFFTST